MKKGKAKKLILTLIGVCAFIVLWSVASLCVNSEWVLPTPWSVSGEFFALFKRGEFYTAVAYTATRAFIGFVFSALFAMALAVLSYKKPSLHTALSPVITVIRAVPTMSVILLTFFWFSQALRPMFIGFLVSFPLLYESFHQALSGVDKKLVEMSKIYGVGSATMIKYLYLPMAREDILSGLKSGISLNLKVVISAEVMVNTIKSVGWQMSVAQMNIMTAELFAWTITAVLLSFAFEGMIELIKYLTRPKKKISA